VYPALKLFERFSRYRPAQQLRQQGRRLHDLARPGEKVEAPTRTVEVYKIEILDRRPGDSPELMKITCGSGTESDRS